MNSMTNVHKKITTFFILLMASLTLVSCASTTSRDIAEVKKVQVDGDNKVDANGFTTKTLHSKRFNGNSGY